MGYTVYFLSLSTLFRCGTNNKGKEDRRKLKRFRPTTRLLNEIFASAPQREVLGVLIKALQWQADNWVGPMGSDLRLGLGKIRAKKIKTKKRGARVEIRRSEETQPYHQSHFTAE